MMEIPFLGKYFLIRLALKNKCEVIDSTTILQNLLACSTDLVFKYQI